ncbi:hypothetical protein GA0070607_3197 [Micromonospora coriariae]|uniref:Uncharacterized protein n=1 Tax=Micromonospora coriariae TaxID=285665 RepID=A0A1C4W6E2_9ACTN|nr:hypothetical protein GA0070607_3197 [Micromonospora coriariae]
MPAGRIGAHRLVRAGRLDACRLVRHVRLGDPAGRGIARGRPGGRLAILSGPGRCPAAAPARAVPARPGPVRFDGRRLPRPGCVPGPGALGGAPRLGIVGVPGGPVGGAPRLTRCLRRERVAPAARRGWRFVGGRPLGGGCAEAGRDLEARGGGADGWHLDAGWRGGGQAGVGPAGAVAGGGVDRGVSGRAAVRLAGPMLLRRRRTLGGHHQAVAGRVAPVLGGRPRRSAHRRRSTSRRFGARMVDAVGLGTRVADAVGVVAIDPGGRLGGAGQPGQGCWQVAVPGGGRTPTGGGLGLPARRLFPGILVLRGPGPPARRGRPPAAGAARVVVLTRSVTVLSRGGGSGLPCFTHRALLGRPR